MRAESDAILIGVGTAIADDPELTVRLAGLQSRSPVRIVIDPDLRLPLEAKLVRTARVTPTWVVACQGGDAQKRAGLEAEGVRIIAAELFDDRVALPELLDDLGAQGIATLMVEGGAQTARHFLADDLVDRIALYQGPHAIGQGGIAAPVTADHIPEGYRLVREAQFGADQYREWIRPL